MSQPNNDASSSLDFTRAEFNPTNSASQIIKERCKIAFIAIGIFLLVNLTFRFDFIYLGSSIGETSVTEMMEQLLLLLSAGAFYHLARKVPDLKHAAVLIGTFFAVMLVRELDYWFDKIEHGAWIYPALLLTGAAIFYAVKNGKQTLEQFASILASPHMNLLIVSLMLLLVYSRLFGMGSFWKDVMHENYIREVKNIAEEGTELLAYWLLGYASFRTVFGIIRKP